VAEHLDEERWKIKQVDAPDGSIILTPQGEVVGLIEFFGRSKGVVKPIEELRKLADRLALNERARRGWLGVRLEQPSEEALPEAAAEVVRNAPVIVKEILPDSPAARTDLKPGDRIYRINDQVITSIQQLADLIAKTPLGTEILLDLYRNGELKHVNVRVEARPQSVIDALRRSAEERRESLSKFRFRLDESASARPLRDADRLARLGIKVEPLTPPMRELLRIEGTGGVLVTEVKTTGLAGQAGLRAGDAIVAVNGKPVSNQSHLVTLLNRAVRTGKATLSVSRQRKDVNITLNLSKPF
jgi:serine protease Do